MTFAKNIAMFTTLVANISNVPLKSKVFHLQFTSVFGRCCSYLSPVPHALPQAAGFSSLSPEPQALPQAAGFSSLSPDPHAVPHAAGAPASAANTLCALWPKPNSFERFILKKLL
jgi:hypothetical protein